MVLKLADNQVQIPIHGQGSEKKAILSLIQATNNQVQFKILFSDSSIWYSPLLEQDQTYQQQLLREPLSIIFDINNVNELSLLNERIGSLLSFKFTKIQPIEFPADAPLCVEDRVTRLEQSFLQLQQHHYHLQESYGMLRDYCDKLQNQLQFYNKHRNLVIGCKVEHAKKNGQFILTHGFQGNQEKNVATAFVEPETEDKHEFTILRWKEEIEFNVLVVSRYFDAVFNRDYSVYVSGDEGKTFELIAQFVPRVTIDLVKEFDHPIKTKYMKIEGKKLVGLALFNTLN